MRKSSTPALLLTAAILSASLLSAQNLLAQNLSAQNKAPSPSKPAQSTKSRTKPSEKQVADKASKPDAPLLPSVFSGWEITDSNKPLTSLTDPAAIDPANAAALKEYGFTDGLLSDYTRSGETLKIKALRFTDASGAYGAYTFYRHSGWPKEQIGTGAASDHNRILFWIGNVFIDAQFSHISAMTGSELRDLASTIPVPAGNKALAPPILGNMPQKDIDGQTTHYAMGSAGYKGADGTDAVLPPDLVGFDRGAETATATYTLRSGPAVLTLINYPTPQMAAVEAKAIDAYLKAGNTSQHPFTKPLQDSNASALEVRRSGPLVAVVSGDAIRDEAHKLVSAVHYEADMSTSIPGGGDTEVQKTAKLLLGIVSLVVVMFVAALLLAIFLGGGRAAYRFARGKPVSSLYDQEFTRLDLKD